MKKSKKISSENIFSLFWLNDWLVPYSTIIENKIDIDILEIEKGVCSEEDQSNLFQKME